ncbi:MAG TPA: tryptophan dimethylallyltransferase family protein [Polyangiaceae bacterium]|nr:tryptophan dimethylallyltransferase family protein [Polyangiaceae bacterium]
MALAGALGISAQSSGLIRVFERLLEPWGARALGVQPRYRSNIADDQAPYEFSLALNDGAPELQFYVEAQGEEPTLRSNLAAGRRLLELAASEFDASIGRLLLLEDLFLPVDPAPPFSLWLGVSCSRGAPIRFKAYLNPQVRGAGQAPELVGKAMQRLGFSAAWSHLTQSLSFAREGRYDELGILSLDLSGHAQARVKAYIRHHGATASEIDTIARVARSGVPGDAARFYSVVGNGLGPFSNKPVLSEAVFTSHCAERPASFTFEFPLAHYVENDEVARTRVLACLNEFGIRAEPYARAIDAFATRPLRERGGLHAHVTFRRDSEAEKAASGRSPTGARVGVYLASEAYLATSDERP